MQKLCKKQISFVSCTFINIVENGPRVPFVSCTNAKNNQTDWLWVLIFNAFIHCKKWSKSSHLWAAMDTADCQAFLLPFYYLNMFDKSSSTQYIHTSTILSGSICSKLLRFLGRPQDILGCQILIVVNFLLASPPLPLYYLLFCFWPPSQHSKYCTILPTVVPSFFL